MTVNDFLSVLLCQMEDKLIGKLKMLRQSLVNCKQYLQYGYFSHFQKKITSIPLNNLRLTMDKNKLYLENCNRIIYLL